MQYFVLVGLHKCLQVKHLRAFAVILALVVAVSGMAIAQDAVKDGKEKRGGFIKENLTIRAQAVKFGTSKKGIKTPSEEIQPVKILDEKVGGTTDEVVVTSPPYEPLPPPPITIGGTAGSGYFGYGNTSDPGAYGGTGSGTGETPAEPTRRDTSLVCYCSDLFIDFAPRPILPDPSSGRLSCPQSCQTYGILERQYYAILETSGNNKPTEDQICSQGTYKSFRWSLEVYAKSQCENGKEVLIGIQRVSGDGDPRGIVNASGTPQLEGIIVPITPCRKQ